MKKGTIGPLLVLAVVGIGVVWTLSRGKAPRPPAPVSASPATEQSPTPARVALEVLVQSGGAPVADAKVGVALGDDLVATGVTGSDGRVALRDLAPGRLRLIVAHPRHVRHERGIEVGAGEITVELAAAGWLRARVLDPGGRAVPAASVQILGPGGKERARCETDAGGVCEIGELEPATLVVQAVTGRHRPSRGSVEIVERGRATEHTFRLSEGRTLSGRVVDDRGAAVPGAKVGSSDDTGGFTTADDAGRFELGGLGDEPINVFAMATGFAPRHVRGLRPGSANVELRLERPSSLEASVELASAAKSLMVSVCARDAHFAKEICVDRRIVEPPEREIVLEGLPSGTFDLVLEAEGHHAERTRIVLSPAQRAKLGVLRLRAAP
ncbi:MAG: carboxypeptidase regulatory-like domain-containing protein [Polyangiaceae bacterium]|nr:carboxypeptidase regulatory-like domain-containing protein [Polyangiaceae bacterium]